MGKIIDARGLSCPQPVLLTLDEIKNGNDSEIVVLVDTETSRENVTRAATSKEWAVADTVADGAGFKISLKK